jgi:hypothetical protein
MTAEEKEQADRAKAALKIQSVARARRGRLSADSINDVINEKKANLALCNEPGFIDLVGDILKNTMLNIIQEAAQGEFVIESEPLKFIMLRDDFFEE